MTNRHDRRAVAKKERKAQKHLATEDPFMEFDFGPGGLQYQGPIIVTDIGITKDYEDLLKKHGKPIPPPIRCKFLIDTGADGCVVKHEIAEKAGLLLIATNVPIQGVGVDTSGREYMGRIHFICNSRRISGAKHLTWVDVSVLSGTLHSDRFDGLLGRDVLSHYELKYNGRTGIVSMRYLKP
jgi:predicted aspartyl protease